MFVLVGNGTFGLTFHGSWNPVRVYYILLKYEGLREAFKKENVKFFTLGGSRSVFFTLFFLQKHGLKWLNIAL